VPVPGPGYAITARVEVPASASAAGDLTVAIGQVGGVVTALDVVESHTATLVVDISCNALNEDHGREITEALDALAEAGTSTRAVMAYPGPGTGTSAPYCRRLPRPEFPSFRPRGL